MAIVARPPSQRNFLAVSALLFLGSAAVTALWCASMSSMDMEMPGGWTMSMAWMKMPDQTWLGSAGSFLGMWTVMMVAMMLPCLVPMLHRYRQAAGPAAGLTLLVGSAYFAVWTLFGALAYPVGVALASVEMQRPEVARAVPLAEGIVVLLAGLFQFTVWKTRNLACCREAPACALPTNASTAWSHGLRLGLHCSYCCLGLMGILLVIGVMDLRLMAVVTAAMAAERLAPSSDRVARLIGVAALVAGLLMIARAL